MNPDLTQISNKIEQLLKDAELHKKYEIETWPEKPDEYQLTHAEGAVLLIFQQWDFQDPTDTTGGNQPTGCDFQISTLNRSLLPGKDNPGAYTMIKDVYEALHGKQIEQNFIHCKQIRLISQKGARFHYAQKWRIPNLQL